VTSQTPDKKAGLERATNTELRALHLRLRSMPAKKRLDAIIERPDVMRVVRSLPVQDVLLTLKEIGPGDALELIELLSPRQVQGILDLDAWRKDRIDPGSTAEWLELLYAANPNRAVRQVKDLDYELLSLLLKLYTRVYEIHEDEDIPEDGLHSVTPDNRYFIAYEESQGKLAHYLKQTIDRLYGVDLPFVMQLIEAVRWETPSSLEEEAFRWRNGRLSDLGFLPPGEAQEVFQYTDPDKALAEGEGKGIREVHAKPRVADDEPSSDLSVSVLLPADLFEEGTSVLSKALVNTGEKTRARVAHELMMVGNRLHMATGGDAGDGEALRATVKRASDTVGIALSYLAKGDPSRLFEPLTRLPVLRLFQVGHSLAVRVSRELRGRVRQPGSGVDGEGLLRLDSPLREMAAGLLRPQPLFYLGLNDEGRSDYQPFTSLHELAQATRAVSEAAFRAELSARALEVSDERMAELGVADAASGPSHTTLLGAWLARLLFVEEPAITPLDDDELEALKSRMEGERFAPEDRARAKSRLGDEAAALSPLAGAPSASEAKERAEAWAERALLSLEAELGKMQPGAVDGRYVSAAFTRRSLEPARAQPRAQADDEDEER
jgi:hypothetical protein